MVPETEHECPLGLMPNMAGQQVTEMGVSKEVVLLEVEGRSIQKLERKNGRRVGTAVKAIYGAAVGVGDGTGGAPN